MIHERKRCSFRTDRTLISFALLVSAALLYTSCGAYRPIAVTSASDSQAYIGCMANARHGVVAGEAGLVRYTEDGGKRWALGSNRSMCMHAIFAINEKNFIAAGNEGNVLVSRDGGKIWSRKESVDTRFGKICRNISFVDVDTGWVATRGWLGETRDSANTWRAIPLPSGVPLIETVFFLSPGSGYLLSVTGDLFRTDDSGASWLKKGRIIDPADSATGARFAQVPARAAIFFSGNAGSFAFLGTKDNKAALIVMNSTDGGLTWTNEYSRTLSRSPQAITIGHSGLISVFNADTSITAFAHRDR